MKKLLISIISFAFCISTASASEVPQKGYSTNTLKEPLFDSAQVALESVRINNWLNSNYSKMSYEQMKGPREHLYYLIDSHVKNYYLAEKAILPKEHDVILEQLFLWSERLGVYGGSKVYNAIKSPKSTALPSFMKLPEHVSISMDNDLLNISEDAEGWSVTIPYYFMIWGVNDFEATNGERTQLIAISTGASKDKSEIGRSHATLMLLYSPGDDISAFRKYWTQQIGIGKDAEKKSLGVENRHSYYSYDPALILHKELVVWKEAGGTYAVAYLGNDGTYQWNRHHFIDFLRSLKTK